MARGLLRGPRAAPCSLHCPAGEPARRCHGCLTASCRGVPGSSREVPMTKASTLFQEGMGLRSDFLPLRCSPEGLHRPAPWAPKVAPPLPVCVCVCLSPSLVRNRPMARLASPLRGSAESADRDREAGEVPENPTLPIPHLGAHFPRATASGLCQLPFVAAFPPPSTTPFHSPRRVRTVYGTGSGAVHRSQS